jgi:hypothetical protein
VKNAESQPDLPAHPRKVLFDAYHAVFRQYGVDTSKDKACLRILLLLAGPHVPGNTLMERFKGVIQQAGFELEYTNENLHIDQVGEGTLLETEAIVKSGQQEHVLHVRLPLDAAELEYAAQDQPLRPRNSRSVPDFGRGSQQSGGSGGNLAAMPYTGDRLDPYLMPYTNSAAQNTESVTDNQTEDVVFPDADQAVIQELVRRMAAVEELAVAKDSHQLKTDSFRIWRDSSREKKARDFYRRKLIARATSQFARVHEDDYKADALHRESVAKRSKQTLEAWRDEARLRPIEQRVSYRHDIKLAQKCVSDLRTLVRLPGHADAVRETALKRKGFDAWGEELRVTAIKEKIDDRLILNALYWWTLATRESLIKRQLDQRRSRRALATMLDHYRMQQDRFRAAESAVAANKKARRIIGAFVAISSKLDQQRQQEQMASNFYHPKIEFENLLLWKDRLSTVQRLDLKANDAREYFLSVKFLRIWQQRAKESKEQRLNQAYKRIRRQGKIRIVRAGIDVWRSELTRLRMLDGRGQDSINQRGHRLLRKHVVRWRNKTSQVGEMEQQAAAQFEARLLGQSVPSIFEKARELKGLQQRADDFYAIHTSDIASRQLRKLKTKAFELRRREQDADAMKNRHEKSHYKNMLRLWARKAAGKDADVSGLENPDEEADRIIDESVLPDIEEEETAVPGPNTHKKRTPIPEYLHTPSNRAARMRALATSTTPATAPPSFAARLLAGGISMSPRGPNPHSRLNESTTG